jgi:hypothetical protein
MKLTRKELRKIIVEEYRAVVSESMGSDHATQLQFLLQDAGEEEFQYVLDSLVTPDPDTEEPNNVFREGTTEARIEVRDDKIRVTVLIPDPDDPDDMEWNGDEDFDKTPEGLIQALEYAKKRLFDSDPIWYGIEQVVRRYDQPYKKRQVEYFIQKNYHGETNQYWTVQAGDDDNESFSVWVIGGGDKFEIRNSWGKTVMETRSPEDVPGMVNKYMKQNFGELNESMKKEQRFINSTIMKNPTDSDAIEPMIELAKAMGLDYSAALHTNWATDILLDQDSSPEQLAEIFDAIPRPIDGLYYSWPYKLLNHLNISDELVARIADKNNYKNEKIPGAVRAALEDRAIGEEK